MATALIGINLKAKRSQKDHTVVKLCLLLKYMAFYILESRENLGSESLLRQETLLI